MPSLKQRIEDPGGRYRRWTVIDLYKPHTNCAHYLAPAFSVTYLRKLVEIAHVFLSSQGVCGRLTLR